MSGKKLNLTSVKIKPRTDNQKRFLEGIVNNDFLFCNGVFGTGKSFLSVGLACQLLSQGSIERVVYTRSTVFLNKVAGYYPGNLTEKMYEYFAQQIEYFEEFLGRETFKRLQADNIVRILPVEILRGRSFDNALVIMDEAQNCSKEEFILLLTRIGRGSKLILIGDTSQRDTRDNFFERAFDVFSDSNEQDVFTVMFDENDILRHKSVYKIYKRALDI